MNRKKILALGGALVVAGAATASSAARCRDERERARRGEEQDAAGEQPTVKPHSGAVTIAGKSCSAASGAGAVALATHDAWSGKWFSFGLEVLKILGETDNFTTTKSYWELFVDNVGIAGRHLRRQAVAPRRADPVRGGPCDGHRVPARAQRPRSRRRGARVHGHRHGVQRQGQGEAARRRDGRTVSTTRQPWIARRSRWRTRAQRA